MNCEMGWLHCASVEMKLQFRRGKVDKSSCLGKDAASPYLSFGTAWQSGSCGRKLAMGQIYGEVVQR
jgi:hypothetical protein